MPWDPPLGKNQIGERWGDATGKITFSIFKRILKRTPVKTGLARENWHVSVNHPSSQEFGLGQGQTEITIDGKTLREFPTIYIQNNVPYIGPLEYGHSKRFPRGMVRITVAEFAG